MGGFERHNRHPQRKPGATGKEARASPGEAPACTGVTVSLRETSRGWPHLPQPSPRTSSGVTLNQVPAGQCFGVGRSRARPGAAPVVAPSFSASLPFTNNAFTPTLGTRGFT